MNASTRGQQKPRSKTRKQRATPTPSYLDRRTRNGIIRDWLLWSLRLDNLVGREASIHVAPYSDYNPVAVAKLIKTFDPSAAPIIKTRTKRRRATPTVTREVQPVVAPVDFREDDLDGLPF